jgi:hypothetical protein
MYVPPAPLVNNKRGVSNFDTPLLLFTNPVKFSPGFKVNQNLINNHIRV